MTNTQLQWCMEDSDHLSNTLPNYCTAWHGLTGSVMMQAKDGSNAAAVQARCAPFLSASGQAAVVPVTLQSLAFLQSSALKCQPGAQIQLQTHGSLSFPPASCQPGAIRSQMQHCCILYVYVLI